jgi:uncharacterized metal-binding protein
MKGKNHEGVSILILLPITFYLGYQTADIYETFYFVMLYLTGTFLITCDIDTYSRSSKRLGLLGWVIRKLFTHRGVSHSIIAWSLLSVLGYYCIGWFLLGLTIPNLAHIIMDKVF